KATVQVCRCIRRASTTSTCEDCHLSQQPCDDIFCALLIFLFSSRRRHTRCYRDWSSDGALPICPISGRGRGASPCWGRRPSPRNEDLQKSNPQFSQEKDPLASRLLWPPHRGHRRHFPPQEIGRASCREGVQL